jgi:hypothetical protein
LKKDIRDQNFSSDENSKVAVCQWFQEQAKDFFRPEFRNLLNGGKSVLKLEEIIWKSNYAQL